MGGYLTDLRLGRLPQVSFIIPSFARGWDEHPPANIQVGMGIQQQLITALMASSAWQSSAYILTYDESGGYFDMCHPPSPTPTASPSGPPPPFSPPSPTNPPPRP